MKFRYKRGIPVPYERQGYIYFKSLRYPELPVSEQKRIQYLCERCGGNNEEALFEHVTTGKQVKALCVKYYIASPTTLYRALKRYYQKFPQDL